MSRVQRLGWINRAAERIDETDGAACALIALVLVLDDAADSLDLIASRLESIARNIDEPEARRDRDR